MQRGRPKKGPVRRRDKEKIDGTRYKLYAPEINGFVTRWVNDLNNRVHMLTNFDDWDFVSSQEISDQDGRAIVGDPSVTPELAPGDRVARIVGQVEGKPLYAYLLKKRKEFYEQDQAEKESDLLEVESQLKRSKEGSDFSHGNVEIGRR